MYKFHIHSITQRAIFYSTQPDYLLLGHLLVATPQEFASSYIGCYTAASSPNSWWVSVIASKHPVIHRVNSIRSPLTLIYVHIIYIYIEYIYI